MSRRVSVLHVDDEPEVLDLSTQLFERADADLSTITAGSGPEGMDALASHDVDCIVSDSVRMPDGESFVEAASRTTDAPIVLFTAKEWREVASDAVSANVSEYVRKADNADYQTVVDHVRRLCDDGPSVDGDRRLIGRHDFGSHAELGVSIVEAVEEAVGGDSSDFGPLYDAIDADALERLFAPVAGRSSTDDVEVHFQYEGLDITVTADGNITTTSLPN
jgi:CheY-like chemotaxis protein